MKGKKAAQAASRRDRNELIEQARAAEQRAEKAERALAALRETHESKVADLVRQRDEASAPAVALARSQTAESAEKLKVAEALANVHEKAHEQLRYVLLGLYWDRGYSPPDIDIALGDLASEVDPDGVLQPRLAKHEYRRIRQGGGVADVNVVIAQAKKRGAMHSRGQSGEIADEMRDHRREIASLLGEPRR